MLYSPVLSILRIFLFIIWTIICVSIQLIFILLPERFFFLIIKLYFKGLINIFGIKVNIVGKPEKDHTLYLSNHTSYLDILILGSELNALFVAKSEISNWPVINRLAKLGKTIFINRNKKKESLSQSNELANYMDKGLSIVLFPEGTSNDGNKVLPFKSSLFEIINQTKNKNLKLQPTAICYSSFEGLPINRFFKPFFAWYGAMDLFPHVWMFLGLGDCEINVNFHKAKYFSEFEHRKEACDYCYEIISNQISKDLNERKIVRSDIKLYGFKYL